MPLRRPFAVVSAAAALLGASVLVTPAAAADDFTMEGAPVVNLEEDAAKSYQVQGTGCTGQDATVGIALLPPGSDDTSKAVTVAPDADGAWRASLDIPALVKESGGDATQEGWSISAACLTYDAPAVSKSYPLVFDSTNVEGSYTIEGEAGSQVFNVQATGFSANENVEIYLGNVDDPSQKVATIGTLPTDADGALSGSLPAPAGVPDGTYRLVLLGDRYGEYASSTKLIQVSGGVFSVVGEEGAGDPGDPGAQELAEGDVAADPAAQQPAEGSTTSTVSVTAGSANAAKSDPGSSSLARTGTNGLLLGGLALGLALIGGGFLAFRRRNSNKA